MVKRMEYRKTEGRKETVTCSSRVGLMKKDSHKQKRSQRMNKTKTKGVGKKKNLKKNSSEKRKKRGDDFHGNKQERKTKSTKTVNGRNK